MVSHTAEELASTVRISSSVNALNAISEPGVSAAIWHRTPTAGFQTWIDQLAPGQLPALRIVTPPERVRDVVEMACDAANTPDCAERDQLISDVVELSKLFNAVMKAPYLRVRLDVVDNNACRKFHIDHVVARLICTFRGHATQYGLREETGDPKIVHEAPLGSPIFLRGERWPNDVRSKIVHRSPPIAGTGETRLVLVFDAMEKPQDESGMVA